MDLRRWAIGLLMGVLVGTEAGAVMPKSAPNGEEVFRLNCGAVGWDYTDPRGNFWLQDEAYSKNNRWGYVNGANYDEGTPTGTDIVPVYRTQRRGLNNLKYVVDLPNGNYQVTLHFIETVFSASGKRVFDVALEGNVVLSRLDIYTSAGGKNRPYSRTFPVTISDRKLEVTFPALASDYAVLSALEVKVQSVSDDAFLDFLQFKMVPYFMSETGLTMTGDPTGLISDKSNGWVDEDFTVASIATTGFGLSVLTVAAERGWIPSDQAQQRIHTTLDLFKTMQEDPARSYHGFWYHFVDWGTGQRVWNSEISTVDSALFILGALQAGEYFRAVDPTIAQKAEELYKKMEWDWFARRVGSLPFLSMGWNPVYDASKGATIKAPDKGYFLHFKWEAYNESVFVNLLALGSPTHPIDPQAWVRMRRHGVLSGGGASEFMHFPPLFGHQYHNLYFDFKNKHDGTSDFWDAAVRASLRDRAQFAQDPLNESDIWGLTACEVPGGGYEAFGSGPGGLDWGITAPTGPLGSIALTPTESMASARKMFFQYKHKIWGRHGFVDSFSISDDSRADNTLGLDNGPIVLAIENYRSGLLWKTFMKSPFVATALATAGFVATGEAPRVFSHSEKSGNRAVFAQDGNSNTGWESSVEDNQWLAVDYGRPTVIDRVRLTWGLTFAKRYEIQTSDDGTFWKTVATKTDGVGGSDLVLFPRQAARMVRWVGKERGGVNLTSQGYSLLEMTADSISVPSKPRVGDRFPTKLAWQWEDNSSGETVYRVIRVSDNVILADLLPSDTVTWTQDNLKGNTPYQVKVEVYSSGGAVSSEASDVVYTPAAPPTELSLNIVNGDPVLSWNGAANSESTRYRAYRTTDRVVYTEVFSGKGLSTGGLALPANREVVFNVFAVTDEDEMSETVSFSTRSVSGTIDSQTGSPNFELKEPPFTVEFASPPGLDTFVILGPVDVLPGAPPSPWRLVGSSWRAEVESATQAPALRVAVRRLSGPEFKLAKWNEGTESWTLLDAAGSGGDGGIFGVFYLPPPMAPSTVDSARIYPNPFRPSRSPFLKIDQVPVGTQVKLFTLLGEEVSDLPPADNNGETHWDGRNGAGHSVAPGVYWGVIDGNGGKKTFRIAVE
jgi:hypothetical protein